MNLEVGPPQPVQMVAGHHFRRHFGDKLKRTGCHQKALQLQNGVLAIDTKVLI
jgi:hypothetical protein